MNEYKSNTEPQIGDRVKFVSDPQNSDTMLVTSVLGGRQGNKLSVVPESNPNGMSREYYYYCFVRA